MNLMVSFLNPYLGKAFSIAKKVALVIVVYTVIVNLFFYFTTKEKRQPINSKLAIENYRKELYSTLNDKKYQSKDAKTILALYRGVNCLFMGEGCTNNPSDGEKYFGRSLLGFMSKGIAAPYGNPPASGVYWVYSSLQDSGFVSKSFAAQGIGLSALEPLSGLWKVFRNVSYLILVILLVSIGFMIMFRVKVNPQTVITLENSLPRIIIALLLITFSFAISGFLIDLMYLVIALGITIFGGYVDVNSKLSTVFGNGWKLWDEVFLNKNIWYVGNAMINMLPQAISVLVRVILAGLGTFFLLKFPVIGPLASGEITRNVVAVTGGIVAWIVGAVIALVTAPLLFAFAPLILSLLVFLTAFLLFFRIFFMLFKSYIFIILLILFSPVILLFQAIPGRNVFFSWLKNLVSHLIAFPLVSILLTVSTIIVSNRINGAEVGALNPTPARDLWTPPFIYTPNPEGLTILVGLGIMFMIPELVALVRQLMGVKESPLKAGAGIFFGGVSAPVSGVTRGVGQFGSLALGVSHLTSDDSKRRYKSIGGFLRGAFGTKPKVGEAVKDVKSEAVGI